MIVIISENDWYGFIPTFNFPCGVFLPFQIVGEKPRRLFFKKIKRFVFNCIALQNNIEAELKFFSSFEAFKQNNKKMRGKTRKIIKKCGGKPPRGFPPQNEMGEKPCGVFTKEYLSVLLMIEISYTVRAHIIQVFTVIKGHKTIPSSAAPPPPSLMG